MVNIHNNNNNYYYYQQYYESNVYCLLTGPVATAQEKQRLVLLFLNVGMFHHFQCCFFSLVSVSYSLALASDCGWLVVAFINL